MSQSRRIVRVVTTELPPGDPHATVLIVYQGQHYHITGKAWRDWAGCHLSTAQLVAQATPVSGHASTEGITIVD